MEEVLKFDHKDIEKYLLGNINDELRQKTEHLKKEDPSFSFFFDLIDSLKKTASEYSQSSEAKIQNPGFEESDQLLLAILSGTESPAEAARHVHLLKSSPRFYEQLLIRIVQTAPHKIYEAVPETAGIPIKSDEEILSLIGVKPSPESKGRILKDLFNNFFVTLKSWFFPLLNPLPRPVYILLMAILIPLGGYRGFVYYHTSYKVSLAENLLKDHYRVYMEDEARLSGGYSSSGVSELMDNGVQKNKYKMEAQKLLNEVLRFDNTNLQARRSQAKLYIISKEWIKADSILTELEKTNPSSAIVLNDKGVLYYSKKQYMLAEQ